MHHLWPLLFLLCSILHLYSCFSFREKLRRVTKVALMPLLLLARFTTLPAPSPLLAAALLLGLAGDVMLLVPSPKSEENGKPALPLLLGIGFFLLGHLFYIALFLRRRALFPTGALLFTVLAVCLLLFLIGLRILRPEMGSLFLPGTVYFLVLMSVFCLSLLSSIGLGRYGQVLGAALFLTSDYILARSILGHRKKYTNFFVMLTYILAQALLAFGF